MYYLNFVHDQTILIIPKLAKNNNNREWFVNHKEGYDVLKLQYLEWIEKNKIQQLILLLNYVEVYISDTCPTNIVGSMRITGLLILRKKYQ